MLTIFSIPKPFVDTDDVHQRNAINSWRRLFGGKNVVLVGDPAIESIAGEMGVRSITGVRTNAFGTPLVSSALELVRQTTKTPYLVYSNCDIILFDEFKWGVELLMTQLGRFFATTRRINLRLDRVIDFDRDEDVLELKEAAFQHGEIESLVCKEVMIFSRTLFETVPDFAVGRGNWDNWMVFQAKQLGVPTVRMTADIPTIHQAHKYSEQVGNSRLNCYVTSAEARQNQRLAGGRKLIVGSTCDYQLDRHGLRPSSHRWIDGEFWTDFPRFAGLLLELMGWNGRN